MNKIGLKRPPLQIVHRPQPKRRYFDVGLGAICLGGADTGGAYCLLDTSLARGIGVPSHIPLRTVPSRHRKPENEGRRPRKH